MEMEEITISLPKSLLDRIEPIAAQRNISVPEFLAEIMENLAASYMEDNSQLITKNKVVR
jgi:metal-responsive CopG/Arc/MetJ family transcriptional regulator